MCDFAGAGGDAAELKVTSFSYQRYSLRLRRPLTTAAAGAQEAGAGVRRGFVVRLVAVSQDSRAVFEGVGEVAPLPGITRSSAAAVPVAREKSSKLMLVLIASL